ncbi:MAG: hypothetical protein K6F44_02000 [Lachnospiraceae bacterium]|nr:hypothetical protein [Lachnospiraceae bacterium]
MDYDIMNPGLCYGKTSITKAKIAGTTDEDKNAGSGIDDHTQAAGCGF